MPDDAYEFLGPDLLAPPPPVPVAANGGQPGVDAPQAPTNELVPTSAAEKFQVQPTAPETKKGSTSRSKESIKKGAAKGGKGGATKGKTRASKTSRETEPMPSLGAFKCQMIFSAIAVTASVGLTLMVLIDGLT